MVSRTSTDGSRPHGSLPTVSARRGTARQIAGVVSAGILLAIGLALSLFTGSGDISASEVIAALTGDGTSTTDLLVRDFRIPRTILAVLVGLALGLAGVVMQAITRNPLADPGILGVNAGAYFAIVIGTAVFSVGAGLGQMVLAILGAAGTAALVYLISFRGPAAGTVVKLVLAGVAIGAVLTGFSQAITLTQPEVFDRVRYWSLGSLQGRQWSTVDVVWVAIVLAAITVVLLGRSLNALTMGEDVARSLGTNVALVRAVSFIAITVLCGAATAAAGPLTFVGLVVPFVARFVVGVDHRWIVAFAVLAGPALVVLADVLGRVLVGSELPVGVVTAFLGAPVMIFLVRRTQLRSL